MKKLTLLLALLTLVATAAIVPAAADEPDCTFAGGSATALHLEDATDDWEGLVGGNGNAAGIVPYGDIHGAGTDIVGAWFANDLVGTKTVRRVHILIGTLTGMEANANFAAEWIWEGGNAVQQQRIRVGRSERSRRDLVRVRLHRYGIDPEPDHVSRNDQGRVQARVAWRDHHRDPVQPDGEPRPGGRDRGDGDHDAGAGGCRWYRVARRG